MNTRSKTAAQLRYERRYQQALEKYSADTLNAFKTGISAVLRQWTALELAIHYQWGGPDSGEYAEALQEELFELFIGPDKVYRDDVSLILEDYLDTQFSTICEDGSPDEIGQLLVSMWNDCIVGNFSLVNTMMEREAARRNANVLQSSQGLAAGDGESDDGDGDGFDGAPNPNELILEAMAEMTDTEPSTNAMEQDIPDESVPLVDEDGFQTVSRKGRKGKSRR